MKYNFTKILTGDDTSQGGWTDSKISIKKLAFCSNFSWFNDNAETLGLTSINYDTSEKN